MGKLKINVNPDIFNKVYLPVMDVTEPYIHLYGGRASGKTRYAAQHHTIKSFGTKKNILCVRQVKDTLRDSAFAEIVQFVREYNLTDYFKINTSPLRIENLTTGAIFFFRGFDDPSKLKSINDVGHVWIEEPIPEIKEYDDYSDLDTTIRGKKGEKPPQIMFTYNPIDKDHWLNTEFHLRDRKDCFYLKTTYKDNEFLDQKDFAKKLEILKRTNPNKYNVYALGEWGQIQEGEIFKKEWFKSFKESDVPRDLPRYFYTDSAHGQENSDQTATICWSEWENNLYVWAVLAVKKEFTEWIEHYKRFVGVSLGDHRSRHYVENKASGFEIEQVLRKQTKFNMILDKLPTKDSKRMRAESAAPTVEGGRVYLLEGASWVESFLYEVCAFPDYKYDDQVDILSSMIRKSDVGHRQKIELSSDDDGVPTINIGERLNQRF